MQESDYVRLTITVPQTHAEAVRQSMGKAGAGKVGGYSYCSFSQEGVGRFMPSEDSNPFIGNAGVLEEVIEVRIETVCSRSILDYVIEEIKKAHPYEETIIDIYPIYEIGHKKAKKLKSDTIDQK